MINMIWMVLKMSSSETLSKKTKKDRETFWRLNSYFHAFDNGTLNEYHDNREKQKKYRQEKKTL